jgi:hypothetical protein
MLNEQGIAKKYWAEAFAVAIDIYNISPRLGNVQTPWELFYGTKPGVRSLRTFGCEVYCRKTAPALTKLGEHSYALMCKVDTSKDEPATLQQALAQDDGDLWQQAADEEMFSLWELGVYELVEKPEGVKLLKNKWVLKIKRDQSSNTERYKTRLVAKGFTQRKGRLR